MASVLAKLFLVPKGVLEDRPEEEQNQIRRNAIAAKKRLKERGFSATAVESLRTEA